MGGDEAFFHVLLSACGVIFRLWLVARSSDFGHLDGTDLLRNS
jgi:hypothetical protein